MWHIISTVCSCHLLLAGLLRLARKSRRLCRSRIHTCAFCVALLQVALSSERFCVRVRAVTASRRGEREEHKRQQQQQHQRTGATLVYTHMCSGFGGAAVEPESRVARLVAAALASHHLHSNSRLPSCRRLRVSRLDAGSPRVARGPPRAVRLSVRPQRPQRALHLHLDSGAYRALSARAAVHSAAAGSGSGARAPTRERRADRRSGPSREHSLRLVAYDLARARPAGRLHHTADRTRQSALRTCYHCHALYIVHCTLQ